MDEKILKLDELNSKIKLFPYFRCDLKDVPHLIDKKHFTKTQNENAYVSYVKFSQSSGQMSTLLQNLPLMIGDKLGDSLNWTNFLR